MSASKNPFLSAVQSSGNVLEFEGCNFLRCRLVLATLSGQAVKIRKIRARDENPGLKEYEASFIRLMDKMTNGSKVEVSETGTTLYYQPGMFKMFFVRDCFRSLIFYFVYFAGLLTGGKIEHDCSLERGVGYFLEPLMSLAPFCKNPVHAVLRGVTNNQIDPSPDLLKSSGLPIFKRYQ